MNRIIITAAALLLAAPSLSAQTTADVEAARERMRAILNLPTRAAETREAGASDSTVRTILDILRERQTPAAEAEEILTTQRDAVREHGPVDNFGAFVQAQLAKGLRGRELAAAIRAEHAARGKGKAPGRAAAANRADSAADSRGNRGRAGANRGRPDSTDEAGNGGQSRAGAAARGGRPDTTASTRGRADSGRAAGKANSKRPN